LSDQQAADLARRDELDIAVDLKGYTGDSRLGIFAWRPAPIQISYLGYPGTLAAPFIDYVIADKVVIPEEMRQHYAESVFYLPDSYQVNDNTRTIADRQLTRAEVGLPEAGFVFCCFNSSYKITPQEFDIWMRLLDRVEGSVLWLFEANQWAPDNLRREAEKRAIDPDRLVFAERLPQAEHLARHRLADLFLDTFNVNAHTTASDALWAGLPVVTRLGRGFAARVAGSLLQAVGLPELVTTTSEDYEALALDLATDPARLSTIKARLATNRLTMPLFDSEALTRHIEAAYETVYGNYLTGDEPRDIVISR
jgi:predicted O-linked N-acetylglucosamine transferase (SPINDLY family)